MTPYLERKGATLYLGDCIEVMRGLPECSVDAVVTDPPYGLGFMGHAWDQPGDYAALRPNPRGPAHGGAWDRPNGSGTAERGSVVVGTYDLSGPANGRFQEWCKAWASECLRVLKPGGHLAAFGGTRTFHRLTSGIEDAGFDIRDCLMWLYGSGFPKSLDVSKAIDKAAGAERTVVRERTRAATGTSPATDEAAVWEGWGTALKPAYEPIVLARKPLQGTVVANVLAHGTGALNIDGCRIGHREERELNRAGSIGYGGSEPQGIVRDGGLGRWPANVALDEEAAALLDEQTGELASGGRAWSDGDKDTAAWRTLEGRSGPATRSEYERAGDSGGASRFFYTSKASKADRGAGNVHPTVKPTDLMEWLVRLVTPPGGLVLDPFGGSGTTGVACVAEGFPCVLIEREAEYAEIIRARLDRPIETSLLAGLGGVA